MTTDLLGRCIDSLSPDEIQTRILTFLDNVTPPRVNGYLVLVALYAPKDEAKVKRSDGSSSLLFAPDTITSQEKYRSCTGMVVGLGPDCYQGPKFAFSGPWCRLGEWVTIPRHEGVQINYRGIPMHWLPDDKIALGIDDPSYVTRG